jgi:Sulfatase
MPKSSESVTRAVLSTAALFLPIFLLIPTFIYSNNPHDIALDYVNILLIAGVLTLAAIAVTAPICLFTRGSFVAAGLGLAIAAKLYFLPSYVPLLDGDEVFAKLNSFEGIWSIASLVVLVAAGILIARRLSTVALGFVVGAFALMGLQPLLEAKNWTFDWPSFTASHEPGSTEDKFLEFSRDGDTLVILLDTVQTDVFAQVLEEKPELQEALSGFTYFWNTIGEAPTTLMSMVPIYSGAPYDGGSVSARYADLRNSSIFSDFEKHGYGTALAGVSLFDCPAMACTGPSTLNVMGEFKSNAGDYLELLEVGLLRVLPTFAHNEWYSQGDGRLRAALLDIPINRAQQHLAMLDVLASGLSVSDDSPNFKMLHLMGTHSPINLDGNCNAISTKLKGKPRAPYKDQVECNIRATIKLIDALKRAGIFDKMTIVLIADHGNNSGEPRETLKPLLGVVPPVWGRRARFDPLFAVKRPGDQGPFRLSAVPARISDLRATLCDQVLKCEYEVPGEDAFNLSEDLPRERCFIDFYLWQIDHRKLDGMPPEAYREFCADGLLSEANYDPSGIPPRSKFKDLEPQVWLPRHRAEGGAALE